ncbi:UNVERIFIED_CONTAM: hypothetical protein FKN15_048188 [Acipenser sinensis]
MDRNALAELLQALESRRDAEERRREERYTALIERVWELETGDQVYQIADAHGPHVELTAAAVDSAVFYLVWELETGDQVYQIADAHGPHVELTAAAVDSAVFYLAFGKWMSFRFKMNLQFEKYEVSCLRTTALLLGYLPPVSGFRQSGCKFYAFLVLQGRSVVTIWRIHGSAGRGQQSRKIRLSVMAMTQRGHSQPQASSPDTPANQYFASTKASNPVPATAESQSQTVSWTGAQTHHLSTTTKRDVDSSVILLSSYIDSREKGFG